MNRLLPLAASALLLAACERKPKTEVKTESGAVPLSNSPADGAAMIKAADGIADKANAAAAARQAELPAE